MQLFLGKKILKFFKLCGQINIWILNKINLLTAKAQKTQRFNYFLFSGERPENKKNPFYKVYLIARATIFVAYVKLKLFSEKFRTIRPNSVFLTRLQTFLLHSNLRHIKSSEFRDMISLSFNLLQKEVR